MPFLIRDEEPSDHAEIRTLLMAAFGGEAEANLIDRLRIEGTGELSLVALVDGKLIGQALFSRMKAPFRALGLAPVSVLPVRQRSGVGSLLIRVGLARAADAGWEGVFVVGDPAFYGRFGFEVALASGFRSPYAGPHFMAMAPTGRLPVTTGSVEYAAAFAALG
jgi:putative acetyltransferase